MEAKGFLLYVILMATAENTGSSYRFCTLHAGVAVHRRLFLVRWYNHRT